jgi:alkaline phosphatase
MQTIPFWNAYGNGLNSIEVDIFLKNDTLYATHSQADIKKSHTIESLYLRPIEKALALDLKGPRELQLLVDIKSETNATLNKLVSVLEKYPAIIHNGNISIVISGNMPSPDEFPSYPDYIHFDYQNLGDLKNDAVWAKVALISLNFEKFSSWNGKGRLTKKDSAIVAETINKAHSFGKPFRFWATPDSKTSWKALADMGVDFINTDMPFACASYLGTLESRIYKNKTTSSVYTPSYKSDKKDGPIKNIILLIGDGNGLTQISSATLANGGELTLTQFKSIGFIKTQSADDFTTDSAAAGTALATGTKTYNRAIGVDLSGRPITNMTEELAKHGYISGCITTDGITGATPASFYAHQKDRSDIKEIATDLGKSKLSLFIGGNGNVFRDKGILKGFTIIDDLGEIGQSKLDRIGHFLAEGKVPGVLEGRGNQLAEATKNGLEFLKSKDRPFFLMVEGAQIDSNGHLNNVPGIVAEGIDFDKAIAEAVKFADASKNTLVIVTADHETSGFSIPQGNMGHKTIEGDFTTHDHTATMVPIFAYGPHSEEFQGVYENNEVYWKILKILDIDS